MNVSGTRRQILTVLLAAVLSLFLGGCSSQRGPDWPALIGKMTYDEAILKLGPPTSVATLTDGTIVGEWLMFSSRVYSTPGPAFSTWGSGWAVGGTGTVSSTPNVFELLTFGPDHILVSRRRIYR